jgi:hypothetical protein
VQSGPYIDSSPIFSDPDPFIVRFAVRSEVLLDLDRSIPIFEPSLWSELSLTRDMQVRSFGWAQQAKLRSSLMALSTADGELLTAALSRQAQDQREYPFTAQDQARLGRKNSIRTVDREVIVEVPEKVEEPEAPETPKQPAQDEEFRESHRVQATLARIGAEMDFRIWVPRTDRHKVLDQVPTGCIARSSMSCLSTMMTRR